LDDYELDDNKSCIKLTTLQKIKNYLISGAGAIVGIFVFIVIICCCVRAYRRRKQREMEMIERANQRPEIPLPPGPMPNQVHNVYSNQYPPFYYQNINQNLAPSFYGGNGTNSPNMYPNMNALMIPQNMDPNVNQNQIQIEFQNQGQNYAPIPPPPNTNPNAKEIEPGANNDKKLERKTTDDPEKFLCKVCYDKKLDWAGDCGHGLCNNCKIALEAKKGKYECPFCRKPSKLIKLY